MKIEARELELEVRKVPVHFREYKADKQWPDTPSRISPTAEVTMGMTKRHLTLSPSTFEEVEQLVTSQLKSDLGRSAHSNCTLRENERREQGGRDEWRKIERIAWNFFFFFLTRRLLQSLPRVTDLRECSSGFFEKMGACREKPRLLS